MKTVRLLLKPLLLTAAIFFLLALLGGVIIHYFPISEGIMAPLGILICVIALFVGGFWGARRIGSRGILCGLAIGAVFAVFIALSGLLAGAPFNEFAVKSALCLLSASLGGIFGVK